jgi:hypothetical protein
MNNDANDITGNGESGKDKLLQDLDEMLHTDAGIPDTEAAFEKESAEGLSHLNTEKIPVIIEQLNTGLRRQLKRKKKKKGELPDQRFVYITVITVLLLIVIAWLVIKKMHS